MRVLYDGLIYASQAAGGINRYFANVIGGLPSDIEPVLTTAHVREVNFPRHPNLSVIRAPNGGDTWRHRHSNARFLRRAERGAGHDIVHPTYYETLTRRTLSRSREPVVLTVWDMIHELFPKELDRFGRHAALKRKAIRAADAIICISENTRRDLLERIDVPESRISVVPLASELSLKDVSGDEPVPEGRYLLYVGSRAPYKNFELLVRALAALHATHPDVRLCVVGAPLTSAERARITELGLDRAVVEAGVANDARVASLYAASVAFVYPTRYEGFGIPPLEAMACETVAITSNVSSIPEVVGDAALTFDPDSVEELLEHIEAVLDDPVLRSDMVRRGRERASSFTWADTVQRTVEVYRTVG